GFRPGHQLQGFAHDRHTEAEVLARDHDGAQLDRRRLLHRDALRIGHVVVHDRDGEDAKHHANDETEVGSTHSTPPENLTLCQLGDNWLAMWVAGATKPCMTM